MWACSPPPRNCSYQCTLRCLTTLNLSQVSEECVITESKLMGQNPRKKTGLNRDHLFPSYPHPVVRSSTVAIVTILCATNMPGGQMEAICRKAVIAYGMFKLYDIGCTDCCFLLYELLSLPETCRLQNSWTVHVMGCTYSISRYVSHFR